VKKRGRKKQSKAKNLLDRLQRSQARSAGVYVRFQGAI
jgi:hypothetical protein